MKKKLMELLRDQPSPLNSIYFFLYYEFACTCKNTNPRANPNKVMKKQEIATLIISDILIKFILEFKKF
jgi:hypothetical protein